MTETVMATIEIDILGQGHVIESGQAQERGKDLHPMKRVQG